MKHKKNSAYIIFLRREIEEAAEFAGTDYETACDVLDNFFETLRMYLEDPRLPYIRLGQLGHFQTTMGAIRKYVGKTILAYRTFPRESLKVLAMEKYAKIAKIRTRIMLARKKRKDGIVWKLVKPQEFFLKELKRVFGDSFSKYYHEDGKRKFILDREKDFHSEEWD